MHPSYSSPIVFYSILGTPPLSAFGRSNLVMRKKQYIPPSHDATPLTFFERASLLTERIRLEEESGRDGSPPSPDECIRHHGDLPPEDAGGESGSEK
jgi:hypothetical protein